MLNYIWGGLIIFSLIFALVSDGSDIVNDTWRNGEIFEVEVIFPANADMGRNQNVRFTVNGDTTLHRARWYPVDDEAELIIAVSPALPEHWRSVAENQESSRKQELRAYVASYSVVSAGANGGSGGRTGHNSDSQPSSGNQNVQGIGARDGSGAGAQAASGQNGLSNGITNGSQTGNGVDRALLVSMEIKLPEVHFVKIRAITTAAFDMAEFAVTLAIGLVGIMALWLGLMKIAEESGLIHIVVKGVRPFMKWLFPELPKDHPAMGLISLNLAANVLGLGNAATPLGIKAMEELQKLNPEKETATNSMCMFLALNTSSVQLLPPVTLVAIMGMRVNELMVAITLTTIFSTIAGITAAKLYARRNKPTKIVNAQGEVEDIS